MKMLLGVILAAGLWTGEAAAESSMRVDLRGLNLRSLAGAHTAVQRISDAADVFCRPPLRRGVRDLDVTSLICRRDMSARAIRMLASDQVRYVSDQSAGSHQYAAK